MTKQQIFALLDELERNTRDAARYVIIILIRYVMDDDIVSASIESLGHVNPWDFRYLVCTTAHI